MMQKGTPEEGEQKAGDSLSPSIINRLSLAEAFAASQRLQGSLGALPPSAGTFAAIGQQWNLDVFWCRFSTLDPD
jgi:hypothetical protein